MGKPREKKEEVAVGEAEALTRFRAAYTAIDTNGDGNVTVSEVRERLKASGSDAAKAIAVSLKGHAEEICPFEAFLEAMQHGMALEDLTMETVTDRQMDYFRRLIAPQVAEGG
eukprot:TRINITY_DN3855_c2_g1_i1.p2 TRINITY_DN3855_c2_g1~~TRINITY_DN3855_c2_g1_i1.p2  ORF type:complete len:126 (+),score=49.95 TRINITY_DN3855_c2_g1_i1:42-380(+)